jgi:HSP20 family protein
VTKHWNPLQDLMLLQERMNHLFEDATDRQARTSESDDIESADWHPAADVYDTENAYLIAVDLPGVVRSDLEIDLDDEKLVIRGNRTISRESREKAKPSVRPHGRFRRSFTIPRNVAQDGILAEYKNGVLEVTLPKRNDLKGQRIQIKVQ